MITVPDFDSNRIKLRAHYLIQLKKVQYN